MLSLHVVWARRTKINFKIFQSQKDLPSLRILFCTLISWFVRIRKKTTLGCTQSSEVLTKAGQCWWWGSHWWCQGAQPALPRCVPAGTWSVGRGGWHAQPRMTQSFVVCVGCSCWAAGKCHWLMARDGALLAAWPEHLCPKGLLILEHSCDKNCWALDKGQTCYIKLKIENVLVQWGARTESINCCIILPFHRMTQMVD